MCAALKSTTAYSQIVERIICKNHMEQQEQEMQAGTSTVVENHEVTPTGKVDEDAGTRDGEIATETKATGSAAEEGNHGLRASSRRRKEPLKMADGVDDHVLLNLDAADNQEESGRGTRTRGLTNPQGPGQATQLSEVLH